MAKLAEISRTLAQFERRLDVLENAGLGPLGATSLAKQRQSLNGSKPKAP